MALAYADLIYQFADNLPRQEDFNLRSQLQRAATSIALNIAEGSTGQSDAEQARFLGLATRSLIETVACQRLITRRGYVSDGELLESANRQAHLLARKLQNFRNTLQPGQPSVREDQSDYDGFAT